MAHITASSAKGAIVPDLVMSIASRSMDWLPARRPGWAGRL
jgi:hypothetical protein